MECVKLKTALMLESQNMDEERQLRKEISNIIINEYNGVLPLKWKTKYHERRYSYYQETRSQYDTLYENTLKARVSISKLSGMNAELAEEYGKTLSNDGVNKLMKKYGLNYVFSKEYEKAFNELSVVPWGYATKTRFQVFCREYGVTL